MAMAAGPEATTARFPKKLTSTPAPRGGGRSQRSATSWPWSSLWLIARTAALPSGMMSNPRRDRVSTTASSSEPGKASATALSR